MSCLWKSIFLHPFHLNLLISKMDRAASTLQHSLGQMTEAVNAKRIWQGLEHRGSTVRVCTCPSLPCAVRGPGRAGPWAGSRQSPGHSLLLMPSPRGLHEREVLSSAFPRHLDQENMMDLIAMLCSHPPPNGPHPHPTTHTETHIHILLGHPTQATGFDGCELSFGKKHVEEASSFWSSRKELTYLRRRPVNKSLINTPPLHHNYFSSFWILS